MNHKIPDFSHIIKDLQVLGWSQIQIADEIGVTQPTISRLLSRERTDPPASVCLPLIEFHKKQMALAKRRARRKVA